jgi:hypothetical protein
MMGSGFQRPTSACSPGGGERIRKSQFDERLAADAHAPRLAVDRAEQLKWKIHVDTLNLASRADGFRPVEMRGQVSSRVVNLVQASGRKRSSWPSRKERLSWQSSAFLLPGARAGPR